MSRTATMPAIVPVIRPAHPGIAQIAVAQRIVHGVLHDPAGCYTVGPYTDVTNCWGGAFAVLAHTDRADHRHECVFNADQDDRIEDAAAHFVDIIGAGPAIVACHRYDARMAF